MPAVHSKDQFWLEKSILDLMAWVDSSKARSRTWLQRRENKNKVIGIAAATAAGSYGLYRLYTAWKAGQKKAKEMESEKSGEQGKRKAAAEAAIASKHRPRLDRMFFQRLFYILKIVLPSYKSREFMTCLALGAIIVLQSFLTNYVNSVSGDLMKHLVMQQVNGFMKTLVVFTGLASVNSVISPLITFLTDILALDFRKNLTLHIHNRYYKNIMYYKMGNLDRRITNPDQRITQDVEVLCQKISNLFVDFLSPLTDVIINSIRMTQIIGIGGPISITLYVFVAFGVLSLVTPNFTRMSQEIQNREGKFRYIHARTVINAESIAFYQGDERERQVVESYFEDLTTYSSRVINKNFIFGITNDYFTKYCPHTISSLIGGLPVFFGPLRKLDKGELFSVLRYLIAVVSFDFLAIGKLIELFRTLMKLSGYTTRVHSILHVMKDIHRSQLKDKSVKGKFVSSDVIKFEDVSIVTPANVLLAKHLNFNIEHQRNTTITGPNGCGKSSLFRTLGELWPLKRGTIHKPGGSSGLFKEIFYLPQKPYNVIGSLRDQIIYPDQKPRKTDEELQELLSLHGIGKLSTAHPEGFDGVQDWDRLSRGEQQRLAMARLFYHKPKFAILDECTSCITADGERNLYEQCREHGITCITISHRPALDEFHDYRLVFDGDGGWKYEKILHETLDPEHGCLGELIDSYQLTETDSDLED